MPPSPSRVVSSPQPLVIVNHPAERPVVASKSWEAPFDHYTVTYPSYNGTIQDFITACIYIQLQYRRIRTSLYDDFIRAWVQGYLPYVRDCDEARPPVKALRAIDWYNEIDDDPLFTSRIVTRQNLQSILNFYPAELQMARKALRIPSNQTPSEHLVSNSYAQPYVQNKDVLSGPLTHASQWRGKEPVLKTVEAEAKAKVPRLSPTHKSTVPPFQADRHILAHKSFEGFISRRAESTGFTRSLSETIPRKRKSTGELHSEGSKRMSLGLTSVVHKVVGSDSGSTNSSERSKGAPRSSVALESTATERQGTRKVDDPEERRRRRLAKHFKKQMAERESIASSAPISNTPTSGQRPPQ
jgi:hypothetical protein